MSFEINPVLAGKFDVADNTPANNYASATNSQNNITSGVDDVSNVDSRRYTKFDHSDTEAGTANLTFSDFMDMINPLEHIPVVSSVYRAITGEQINPVSRVAGDILYGGLLGAASAVFGGMSAVADAGLEAQTGKDSGGLAIAALFGPGDKNDNVQLAAAGAAAGANVAGVTAPASIAPAAVTQNIEIAQSATGTPLLAALSVPVNHPAPSLPISPDAALSNVDAAPAAAVASAPASAVTSAPTTTPASPVPAVAQNAALEPTLASTNTTSANPASLGSIPLANGKTPSGVPGGKQPFGGVMSNGNTQANNGNMQAQDMALALAQGAPSMRMGHMIYTNKLMNGPHPLPPMLTTGGAAHAPVAVIAPPPQAPPAFTPVSTLGPSASAQTGGAQISTASANNAAVTQQNSAMSSTMMNDMMMKALSQYGKVAVGPGNGTGSNVNLTN